MADLDAPTLTPLVFGGTTITALTSRVIGTGGHVWDGARLLCEFLATPIGRATVYGRAVLELGAGTHGAPGLLAAHLGASSVLLTDRAHLLPSLLAAVRANVPALAAAGAPTPHAAALEFGGNLRKALGGAVGAPGAFHLVLMSETLSLSPALFPLLQKTLRDAAPGGGLLAGYRAREGFEGGFWEGLRGEGWRVAEVARGWGCSEPGLEGCPAVVVGAAAPGSARAPWE